MEFVHCRDAWVVGTRRSIRPLHGLTFYRRLSVDRSNRRAAIAALEIDPRLTSWFKQSWIRMRLDLHTVLRASDLVISNDPTTFVLDAGAADQRVDAAGTRRPPCRLGVRFALRPQGRSFPAAEVARAIDEAVDRQRTGEGTDARTR